LRNARPENATCVLKQTVLKRKLFWNLFWHLFWKRTVRKRNLFWKRIQPAFGNQRLRKTIGLETQPEFEFGNEQLGYGKRSVWKRLGLRLETNGVDREEDQCMLALKRKPSNKKTCVSARILRPSEEI
jgi:hypothetical protein